MHPKQPSINSSEFFTTHSQYVLRSVSGEESPCWSNLLRFDKVLRGVNFRCKRKEIYALLGANGAGKTTFINCLKGTLKFESGQARVLGAAPSAETAISSVSWVSQNIDIPPQMNVIEAFAYQAAINFAGHLPADLFKRRGQALCKAFGLHWASSTQVGQMSVGEQRRLAIAINLITSPELLILDEPAAGVDPKFRADIWKILREVCSSCGTTVILSTHHLEDAALADTVGILHNGVMVAEAAPSVLIKSFGVSSLYQVFESITAAEEPPQDIVGPDVVPDSWWGWGALGWWVAVRAEIGRHISMMTAARYMIFFWVLFVPCFVCLYCSTFSHDPSPLSLTILQPNGCVEGGLAWRIKAELEGSEKQKPTAIQGLLVKWVWEVYHRAPDPMKVQCVIEESEEMWTDNSFKPMTMGVSAILKLPSNVTCKDEALMETHLYLDERVQLLQEYYVQPLAEAFTTVCGHTATFSTLQSNHKSAPINFYKLHEPPDGHSLLSSMTPWLLLILIWFPIIVSFTYVAADCHTGAMEYLILCGLRPWQYVLSFNLLMTSIVSYNFCAAFGIISIFQESMPPRYANSMWEMLLFNIVTIAALTNGIFLSQLAFSSNQNDKHGSNGYRLFLSLFLFPLYICSSPVFPLESQPTWMRSSIGIWSPVTMFIQVSKHMLLHGVGFEDPLVSNAIRIFIAAAVIFNALSLWLINNSYSQLLEAKDKGSRDMGDMVLSTQDLEFSYPGSSENALAGVNVEVPALLCALIGPNASGKTTLLRTLSGCLRPKKGQVRFSPILTMFGVVQQGTTLVDHSLTIFQVGYMVAALRGLSPPESKRAIQAISRQLQLPLGNQKLGTLSVGQLQRVKVALCLLGCPSLLLLDEPTTGLDPRCRSMVWRTLQKVSTGHFPQMSMGRPSCVLVSTYHVEEEKFADVIFDIQVGAVRKREQGAEHGDGRRDGEWHVSETMKEEEEGETDPLLTAVRAGSAESVANAVASLREEQPPAWVCKGWAWGRVWGDFGRQWRSLDKLQQILVWVAGPILFVWLSQVAQDQLHHAPVMVVDAGGCNSPHSLSRSLMHVMRKSPVVSLQCSESQQAARTAVDEFRSVAVLRLPTSNSSESGWAMEVDASAPLAVTMLLQEFQLYLHYIIHTDKGRLALRPHTMQAELQERMSAKGSVGASENQLPPAPPHPLLSQPLTWQLHADDWDEGVAKPYGQSGVYRDYFTISVLVFCNSLLVKHMGRQVVMDDRTAGLLDTPHLPPAERLLVWMMVVVPLGTLHLLLGIATFIISTDFPFQRLLFYSSVPATLLTVAVQAATGVAMGLAARDFWTSWAYEGALMMAEAFLCGMLYPIEGLPQTLFWISQCLPLSWSTSLFKSMVFNSPRLHDTITRVVWGTGLLPFLDSLTVQTTVVLVVFLVFFLLECTYLIRKGGGGWVTWHV